MCRSLLYFVTFIILRFFLPKVKRHFSQILFTIFTVLRLCSIIFTVLRLKGTIMEEKSYHHGDLRHSLIEVGIEIIKQEGEEALSLRKAAAKCGVSNAAPYAHFKNKNEFLAAIQQHIMYLFAASLEEVYEEYKNADSLLLMLGKSYVMFFYQNPFYYDFLFSRKNININLLLDNPNLPLAILKKAATSVFQKTNMPEEMIQNKMIAMWALVHGLTALITMPDIEYDHRWEVRIEEIIKSVSISQGVPDA